jgi:hypothetical protein
MPVPQTQITKGVARSLRVRLVHDALTSGHGGSWEGPALARDLPSRSPIPVYG